MDEKAVIFKNALENAIKYNGKANANAVVGKVFSEISVKNKKKVIDEIKKAVKKVNSMKLDLQKKKFNELGFKIKEKKEKEKELKELENSKKVIMRFEPSPSGPLHIGHAYTLSLNSEYCRKYDGKLILRISDTNPENIYEPAYKLIEEDAKWITNNNISEVIIQSSRLAKYYDYADKLVNMKKAYICTCDPDKFRKLIAKGKPCKCRNLLKKEQLKRWDLMFTEYKPGDAVLRIKTDLRNKNPALRDWPAFRINTKEHPLTKKEFRVWPLMNFSVAIDDHDLGITHTIRAKDHMDNEKKQEYIFKYFNWKIPQHLYVGKINFEDLKLSTTETRKLIEYGKFSGWDDIRLPFLQSLKKRGYKAEAFIKYALDIGVTEVDKVVSKEDFLKSLNSFNKEIVEKSPRYFFVENPVKIKIKNVPKLEIKVPLHPDFPEMGNREFKTYNEFYISDKIERNQIYRFMHLFNFKDNEFLFESYRPELNAKLIHWLPVIRGLFNVEILMENGEIKKGLGESNLKNLKEGDIIQFERFSFCRLNKIKKKTLTFWFLHK